MGRKENNPRVWTALGPRSGAPRVIIQERSADWFPSPSLMAEYRFYINGVNINDELEKLNA